MLDPVEPRSRGIYDAYLPQQSIDTGVINAAATRFHLMLCLDDSDGFPKKRAIAVYCRGEGASFGLV